MFSSWSFIYLGFTFKYMIHFEIIFSILFKIWVKKQRHYFADKGPYSQTYGFSSSHAQMWEVDHKEEVDHWRTDAFELWYWRRLLRFPWTAKRSKQSIPKEINPEYSLKGLMLKLILQYFGHLVQRADSLERPWCWERLKAVGEGGDGGEMVGWHHRLSGHELGQKPGDSEGQGSLVYGSPWGCKESDTT